MEKTKVPTFFIKPANEKLLVKDPKTREPLKATGEEKPRNTYWLRRIKDKSVVQLKSLPKAPASKETK